MIAAIVRGWPAAVSKAGLTSRLRSAHFLTQIMTEAGGRTILEESGAYSARRMLEIFGVGHLSSEQQLGGSTWQVYNANSGGHATRIHARWIHGYTIVNPRA